MNLSLGFGLDKYRVQNGTLLNPFASDLSLLYKSYDSGYLREDSGLDAQIVGYPELIYNKSGLKYNDAGAFDIASTGEISISFWLKTATDITTTQYVLGKNIAAQVNGRYGLYITSSLLNLIVTDAVGNKLVQSTTILANTWYHITGTFKSGHQINLYINKVKIGAGTALGTVSALSTAFNFYVGAGNSADGSTYANGLYGRLKDVHVFNRIISTEEIESCYNETIIGDESALYHLDDYSNMGKGMVCFDSSANKRHLVEFEAASALNAPTWGFAVNLNKNALLYGYDLYYSGYIAKKFIYVPHKADGSSIDINSVLPSGYYLVRSVAGSVSSYNMAPALIDFNPAASVDDKLDILDRSNVTIQSTASRASTHYDAAKPHRYASVEIFNINTLKGYFETDYKWKVFPQISDNSVYQEESYLFKKLLVYATQKTTAEKETVLQFTGDKDKFYTLVTAYSSDYIAAVLGNKQIKVDGAGGLYYSSDIGINYGAKLDVSADMDFPTFTHIFENGNILFCGKRKVYLSTDNLATYNQITVYDINGDAYTPAADGAFLPISIQRAKIGSTDILIFGTYAITAPLEYNDVNVWYSADNGLTLKSAYKFNVSEPTAYARHIHTAYFNANDNSFWITTGDAVTTGEPECHIMRGVYDVGLDTWAFEIIASGNGTNSEYTKIIGMLFDNGYTLIASDTGIPASGVWRFLNADILTPANYQRLTTLQALGFAGNGSEMILTNGSASKNISVSPDGKHFTNSVVAGGATMNALYPYLLIPRGKNGNGYWIVDQVKDGDTYPYWQKGEVLMVKLDKNN